MVSKIDLSEPGFITIDKGTGHAVRYATGSRLLGNLVVALIRTLIARDIIQEDFADNLGMDITLDEIIVAVEEVGGAYQNPDLKNLSETP